MAAQPAIRAYSFIDTVGVNTHIDFARYGYQNLAVVEASINYLGLKNLRDSAQTATDARAWLQVARATGAKFDDYIAETSPAGMSYDLSFAKQLAREGLLNFLEGGNEEDDAYPAALGNTLAVTARFQQQVYATGHALGLPVINMSFGAGWTWVNNWQGDYGKVGNLSAYTDYANAHTYPLVGQGTDDTIHRLNGLALLAAASRPVITTEIGWDENQGFAQADVALFALDAVLDGVKDGDVKTYFYALYDDASGRFGLMNQDGTPKPAGTAIHNLTTLLADTGATAATFVPGSFGYVLAGNTANDNTLLMQKSDGSYWLSLWNEKDAAHRVKISLSAVSQIKVFDPLKGTASVQSQSNVASVTLSMSDHPLLIKVIPGKPVPLPPPQPVTVTIAPTETQTVVNDSSVIIRATAGDHWLFIGGTHDVAILTGGTEHVQAYGGYNRITTGAGNDTVRIAGTHNVVNAGAGVNRIEDSGSGNTLVMPGAGKGMNDIYGYLMSNGDRFSFTAALKGTNWGGLMADIGDYLHVQSGKDALISISNTAGGAARLVANLHSVGPVSLSSLLAHSIF